MASGLAHDINNALSAVVCYSELLLDDESNLTEQEREFIEAIGVAGTDITRLVARMRDFYRAREDHDLLEPIDCQILGRDLPADPVKHVASPIPSDAVRVLPLRMGFHVRQ